MDKCILLGMLPAGVGAHLRAARRERLLSWRSLLDAAYERLDQPSAGVGSGSGAGQGGCLGFVPPEFWSHHRAAHREDLLAFRSLVEALIGKLEASPSPRRATRIEVI